MIYKLQKKFILITALSVFAVIIVVFSMITIIYASTMNGNLDVLADNISKGGGKFPDSFGKKPEPNTVDKPPEYDFITPETRFSTRYFAVWINSQGEVTKTNTAAIFSVTEELATDYALSAIETNKAQGWLNNFRYKIFEHQGETIAVFVDGSQALSSFWQTVIISACVLLGSAVLIILLIALFSKKVVKPFADNYEKQKQFITDANHELKTPLTLILANIDIAEAELGQNEWLDDAKTEGKRMTELINRLVELSRANEDIPVMVTSMIKLSELVSDAVADFGALSSMKEKNLISAVQPNIEYSGDEALLRRLLSVLLDNAIKYCDEGGKISVSLIKKKNVVLTVENTYQNVKNIEFDKLFDRFYRADSARTYIGGFGVGLSIAKAIVVMHRGEICAYKKENDTIVFKISLK